MNKVRILVVEDEFIVAEDIRLNLEKLGYDVYQIAETGEEAIGTVGKIPPDIVLLDIRLGEGLDGITTAGIIRKMANVPLIFITAHSDKSTFERAKLVSPHAYIVKPFNFHNLQTAIELALFNFSQNSEAQPDQLSSGNLMNDGYPGHYFLNETIFIKSGNGFEKVRVDELCYVKADGSYSMLHTRTKVFTVAMNLHTVMEKLNRLELVRVHRSYLVNTNCIDRIESKSVKVGEIFIPISKKIHDQLLKRITTL